MAAGDFLKRRNNAATTEVPDAGSSLTLQHDTSVASQGSGITYSAGTYTLGETGRFLVMCSEQIGTTDTTNNERVDCVMRFELGGTDLFPAGYGHGYIRRSGGSQECILHGAAIVNVTSTVGNADELQVIIERFDNSTAGTVNRIADRSGITIIKLDDSWNFGRYESSAVTSTSGTDNTANDMNIRTNLEEDSPFTRTTDEVDIASNNLILCVYSIGLNDASVTGRSEYQSYLTKNGIQEPGTWSQTYGPRGADNANNAGMSVVCLLDNASGDDWKLILESRESGGEDFEASIAFVELPSGAEACIYEATTGDMNTAATNFTWDTNPYIDTAAFTGGAGQANIDVDNADDYLAMVSQAVVADAGVAGARAVSAVQFRVNTTDDEAAGHSNYNRASGTADHPGMSTSTLLTGLSASDSVYVRNDRIGTVTTAQAVGSGAFSLIRLSSLFSSGADHALLAEDIESASEVTNPSVGQDHDLNAADVESASEVGTPALDHVPRVWLNATQTKSGAEECTVTAWNAAGTSVTVTIPGSATTGSRQLGVENTETGEIGWIAVTVNASGADHDLLADDVESASEVSVPALGQLHVVLADDVQSTSEVTTPVITQVHAILANDVESASEVTNPAVGQAHVLLANDIESASEVTTPAVSESHGLLAEDVESASEVTTPSIGQVHGLLANDVESASEVTNPVIAQAHAILANDIESASEVTTPALSESHSLLAEDIESASEVSTPALAVNAAGLSLCQRIQIARVLGNADGTVDECDRRAIAHTYQSEVASGPVIETFSVEWLLQPTWSVSELPTEVDGSIAGLLNSISVSLTGNAGATNVIPSDRIIRVEAEDFTIEVEAETEGTIFVYAEDFTIEVSADESREIDVEAEDFNIEVYSEDRTIRVTQ